MPATRVLFAPLNTPTPRSVEEVVTRRSFLAVTPWRDFAVSKWGFTHNRPEADAEVQLLLHELSFIPIEDVKKGESSLAFLWLEDDTRICGRVYEKIDFNYRKIEPGRGMPDPGIWFEFKSAEWWDLEEIAYVPEIHSTG